MFIYALSVTQGQSSGNTQPAKLKYLLYGPLQEKFLVPGFKNSLPIHYETLKWNPSLENSRKGSLLPK